MNNDLNKFYDELSEWYDLMYFAQGVKLSSSKPEVVSAYDWLIRKKRSNSVLDCACGTGDPLIGLFKLPNRRYRLCGSDGSKGMLNKCKNNARKDGLRVSSKATDDAGVLPLIYCSWKDLHRKFRSNQFDFVICRGHGFYHLTKHDAFMETLSSFKSITSQGGWILFDTLYWRYDKNGRICGEQDRDLANWRGVVDFIENPQLRRLMPYSSRADDINRVYFVDFTDYREDPAAVGGVIQTKTLVVFGERTDGKMSQIDYFSASGAAFSPLDGIQLLEEAGLKNVQQVKSTQFSKLKHHVILMGKKG